MDLLDEKTCYRALRSRDARFDGRFFTAVKTTGVFCRPVCPARTPNRGNCTFYPCAAAALEAGFRPCLRCRPEASPSTPAWALTSATVARAMRLIGDGALDGEGVDELAARVGVGARHLRALFAEHLGASPLAVASTRRVLFAKKLLDETTLPITEIALSSGFSSLRRFNAAMSATYGRPPRALRRRRVVPQDVGLSLALPYHAPFDFASIAAYLGPRAIVDGELALDGSRDLDETRRVLLALPGIGPWTVEYVAMRALRDPDAFPAGDLGLRRALGGVDARTLEKRAERYRPFRAYAAMLLWTT